MQDAAYLFEKNWCGDPHTTAAPPVAVCMMFSGRDTFHVSTEERQTASSSEVRAERKFLFFLCHTRKKLLLHALTRRLSSIYSSRVPCYSGRERRLDAERTACPVRTKDGIPARNETCRTLPLRRENKALTYLSAKRMTPKRPDDLTERERTTWLERTT